MADDQHQAPIRDALAQYRRPGSIPFGVHRHASGKGAPDDIKQIIGVAAFEADATTQTGIDDRLGTQLTLQRAERLAAHAWGAEYVHLSTNGTSLSNHAGFLFRWGPATCWLKTVGVVA